MVFTEIDEVDHLALKYIEESIIPVNKKVDAQHIAIATINQVDALVSWNFKHLANLNKQKMVHIVNLKEGYDFPLSLTTPLEVMDA